MKNVKISVILFPLVILLTANLQYSCEFHQTTAEEIDSLFYFTANSDIYYDIKGTTNKHYLPYVLAEVSGLSFYGENKLLMLEDETASIYEYDLSSKKIEYRLVFGSPGDFEGVEAVGNKIYALKSNGDLFTFNYEKVDQVNVHKYETRLRANNDVEGLGYDPVNDKLLLITKDDGNLKDHKVEGSAAYYFNTTDGKIELPEMLNINNKKLKVFFEKNKGGTYEEEKFKFKPSAIAVHPVDNNIYILASKGHMLLVLNRDGEILASYPLLASILPMPEGICFAPNGDMFIASEGDGERGFFMKFKMLRK